MATTRKEDDMASCQQSVATLLPEDLSLVDEILRRFPKAGSSDVIPLLQAVQQRWGYLPREVLEVIAEADADFADPHVRRGDVLRAVPFQAGR